MCRFTLYLGPTITLGSLLTEPDHSLIHQSSHAREREEPLNGDGFGVAYYVPQLSAEPGLFRSVTPAWSNANLRQLARVTESPCILAHVRAATQGHPVAEMNCHPFVWRQYALAHNGDIGGFSQIRRRLLAELSDDVFQEIYGTTDSEHLFALFLEYLQRDATEAAVEQRMATALSAAVSRIVTFRREAGSTDESYINVAVTDGRCAVVLRYTTDAGERADTLYLNTGHRYTCDEGVCQMIEPESGEETVIASSEPLSDDPGWQLIPVNHLGLISADRKTSVRAFEPGIQRP